MHAENVSLYDIAKQYGTPCYVYSRATLEQHWQALDDAFADHPHTLYFAVKANSNIAVLNVLAQLGSGFDIVSEGELYRVLQAGGEPSKIVFSGVAKSEQELSAAIRAGVGCINIESTAELDRVQSVAESLDKKVNIGLRVNPDVDPETHPYISTGLDTAKFGIAMDEALKVYLQANGMPNLHIHSIACHIGSQITKTTPFSDALDRVVNLVKQLADKAIHIEQLDLGGGLGIDYQGETPPSAKEYVHTMLKGIAKHNIELPIGIEPGRFIAGNAGVLLTKVEYLKHNKHKKFMLVDAGMNDLLRPALYQAFHQITNIHIAKQSNDGHLFDIAGPVCESADVFGHGRNIHASSGDLLAIRSAGAYAFVMSSNYNSRPRPPEVMVDGDQSYLIRQRETFADLIKGETLLPN